MSYVLELFKHFFIKVLYNMLHTKKMLYFPKPESLKEKFPIPQRIEDAEFIEL